MNLFRNRNRKVLSLFVTAGYPSIERTVPLVVALAGAGADIIELGVPFSDPIADGPVIQSSSETALRNGITLKKTMDIANEIHNQSDVPVVIMGYANPIFAFGLERFLNACLENGVQGTIIPDLPLEESGEYREIAAKLDIATIFLAAPTTPLDRLTELDKASTGFLYCVSVTGVTGERRSIAQEAEQFLTLARSRVTRNPLLVGFGIATPEDAKRIVQLSDGVIIGSALIKLIQRSKNGNEVAEAVEFARSVRRSIDGG